MRHPGDDEQRVLCAADFEVPPTAGPCHARFVVSRMCTGSRHSHLAVASLEIPYADSAISVPSCYMRPSGACSHLCDLSCCFPRRHLRRHQKLCLHLAQLHELLDMHLRPPRRLVTLQVCTYVNEIFVVHASQMFLSGLSRARSSKSICAGRFSPEFPGEDSKGLSSHV